eukprot:118340_1
MQSLIPDRFPVDKRRKSQHWFRSRSLLFPFKAERVGTAMVPKSKSTESIVAIINSGRQKKKESALVPKSKFIVSDQSWKVGSKVEVYSYSKENWYEGRVVDVTDGWLTVSYIVDDAVYSKQVLPGNGLVRRRRQSNCKTYDDDEKRNAAPQTILNVYNTQIITHNTQINNAVSVVKKESKKKQNPKDRQDVNQNVIQNHQKQLAVNMSLMNV